jgi:hypothetical protein
MRAFIFSLDSFVAFTLALVAIYTLIFFSAIPSSYYYLLTQGHYLAKDALYSLSTSDCLTPQFSCSMPSSSILDNIVFMQDSGSRSSNIVNSIGSTVPIQFGYVLEVSTDNGATWASLYDTSSASGDPHAKAKRKLSVSSQVVAFKNPDDLAKDAPNPFSYRSCNGGTVLTCSKSPTNPPTAGGLPGDYVPTPGFRLVRLTIFI